MKTLATYNIKGGVGKTTAAVNLSVLAVERGRRVLLWDLDPQAAATFLFRVRPKVKGGGRRLVRGRTPVDGLIKGTDHEGLDLLPADFSYRHMDLFLDGASQPKRLAAVLEPLADEYDLVFLDCPPSISLVSENVFRASDALLVPLIPTTLSLRTLDQLERFVADELEDGPELLPFVSMIDRRKALHREIAEELGSRPGVLRAQVPTATEAERMGVHRDAVGSFAPTSRVARAFATLWAEIEDRLAL
ncbi:MAG: ParA family protein [Acidimicrobiia bacterium]